MTVSREFHQRLEALVDEEIARQTKADCAEIMAGDWDGDIEELLFTLRKKSKDPGTIDYIVLYLFSELVNEGRITFQETTYSGDSCAVEVFTPDSCEGVENKINIYSYAKDRSLQITLNNGG
jgi:hypothetical protein